MSDEADPWRDGIRAKVEPPPSKPPSRAPAIIGAIAAVVVSSSLAWWLSRPEPSYRPDPNAVVQPQAAPIVRTAAMQADLEQVRRAYGEFTEAYANGGAEGLARFAESCRGSLASDPRILDYCLAFDLYADSVRPAPSEAERTALIRAALPADGSPEQRIRDVQALMRQVSGLPETQVAKAEAAPPAARVAKVEPSPAPARRLMVAAKPKAISKSAPAMSRTCRLKSTPADRLLCAYPQLGAQHRRMRAAYDKALAGGANPQAIDEGQAEWRVARNAANNRAQLQALYVRRIRQLEAAAKSATPPG